MCEIKYILLPLFIILNGCAPNPEQFIVHVEGYWEIHQVEQNNSLLKAYDSNFTIDYFKVNPDGTGFRKKVTPTLEGTFTVSHHYTPFRLEIEHDSLNIYYNNDEINFKETIKRATQTELVITNAQGFKYTYKPFNKIIPENEQTP